MSAGAAAALAAALALALKAFYSGASAQALRWILGPTAAAVGALLGEPFAFERGVGYVSRPLGLAIAPACAGVNFLIAAAGSLLCVLAPALRGPRGAALAAGALAAAYAAAVAANSVRIVGDVLLRRWAPEAVDAARLHRLEGALVYLACLFALHLAAHRALGARHA